MEIDGKIYNYDAFAVSIANSSQYGNNVLISPDASVTDGLLDVGIIKPFPLRKLPYYIFCILKKDPLASGILEIIRGADIRMQINSPGLIHLDGEPVQIGGDVHISVKPLSLNIISPKEII